MTTQSPFLDPNQLELDDITRRRQMADALRQQAGTTAQGQMVGGRYVGAGLAQQMQPLLAALASRYMGGKADADMKVLSGRVDSQNKADMEGFVGALRGKPAETFQPTVPNDDEGNAMPVAQSQAVGPDRNKALAIALASRNPTLQTAGGGILKSMLADPKWEKAELPNPDGSKRVGFVNVNSPDPISTFQAGGTAPVKNEYVNGQGVNPYTNATSGAAIPKQLAPDSVVAQGPNGTLVPNAPVIAAKSQVAAAGKPVTNVSVNTATKPFLTEIGKGAGEQVVNDFAGARSAVQTLNNVQQIESGLRNVIAGPGANVRLKLGQIGQILGVNGKDATEQLQNTRNVMQGLARQELAAAGQMKGQGQITESERAILRKAESGDISEITVPEMQTLLGALKKTSSYRIGIHQQNMDRLKKDPNASGVVDYMNVQPPAASGGNSILDQADAILRGGK